VRIAPLRTHLIKNILKKIYLAALMALILPSLVWAQFSIRGQVTDKTSQRALAGASITVGDRTGRSNASGEFALQGLEAGTYRISFRFIGFEEMSTTINVSGDIVYNAALSPMNIITDEVIVRSTRATESSATTYRNLNKEELDKYNQGQDLPYLLNQTPSVVVSSDAGTGIGYTGLRIRGSDATRINVTLNGIPLNNPESQGSFFVNIPDFASSVDNIQIQRGVGTSTNGAGAFGGSLNIQTTTRRDSAYAELNNTFGSFDTWKNTVNIGTGLLNGKFTFDGRLSRIKSDGYIDRGASDLKSYFLSGAYYGKKDMLRVNVFSGQEETYQAWNGVPEAKLRGSAEDLNNYYQNNKKEYFPTPADSANLFGSNKRTYNSFLYKDQTDNYKQDHYQAFYTHTFSNILSLSTALHYTYGSGYFEEYKNGAKFGNYGLPNVPTDTGTLTTTDLVRRRWLDNHFYGLTYSLNYTPSSDLNLTLGGAYNEYDGDHFGEITWARHSSTAEPGDRYYQGNGFKTDFNIYGKVEYQIDDFLLYGDLQYRRTGYKIGGNDKNLNNLDINDQLNFFNPKAGITYKLNNASNVYASFAVANKEPNRDDYINMPGGRPLSENLKDIEAGYRFNSSSFRTGINGYWMIYKDQLVLTGKVNDDGEAQRQNVADSYRLGLEADAQWLISRNLTWGLTANLSRNKIDSFTEFVDNWDTGDQTSFVHKNTDISFSPSFVGSSELAYRPLKNAEIALLSKYVSKQYMDNTSNNSRSLDAFFVNDLRLRYNTSAGRIKNLGFSLLINNVFSELYESNGFTYSYIVGNELSTSNAYFPQATRNFLLSANFKF